MMLLLVNFVEMELQQRQTIKQTNQEEINQNENQNDLLIDIHKL